MRVVDTSAWIEWLTGSPLGKTLGTEFPDKPSCIVPTIVQLELSKWLLREVGEECCGLLRESESVFILSIHENQHGFCMTTTVAERGQVTIPKALRDKLGIKPGTVLNFTAENGRLVATKVIAEHPVFQLLGRHGKGRRTDSIMAELRGPQASRK